MQHSGYQSVNEATSDSFQFGLKALLKKHADLQPYASTAHQLTELIETYGDVLRFRAKYQTDGGEHEQILAHYESVCSEREEHLPSSLSNSCLRDRWISAPDDKRGSLALLDRPTFF